MPYGTPNEMESAKQERKDLMKDNPVARTAAGNRPWIAKHYKSSMSPMSMDTPMKKHDGKDFKDKGFMDSHFPSGKPRGGDALKMDHK